MKVNRLRFTWLAPFFSILITYHIHFEITILNSPVVQHPKNHSTFSFMNEYNQTIIIQR